MTTVSIFKAKTNLAEYVARVAANKEPFIVIVKNGVPIAKIVPYETDFSKRIGIAKGKLPVMPSLEEFNDYELEQELTMG